MGKHGQYEDEGVILLRNAFLHVLKYSMSRPTPPQCQVAPYYIRNSNRIQSNGGKITINGSPRGGYSSTISLTSELGGVGGERRALVALLPGKTLGTHRIGGWIGRSAGMNVCGKSRLHQDSIHGPAIP